MTPKFVQTRYGSFIATASITKLVQINGPKGTFHWNAYVGEDDYHEIDYETGYRLAHTRRAPMPLGAHALFDMGEGLEVGETVLAVDLSDSGVVAFHSVNGENIDARGVLFADGSVDLIDDGYFPSLADAKVAYAKHK
jgi:hypothetical protein